MTKHIVIVAGEESGDLHAASFVRELKKKHAHIVFTGIGGRHMEQAGVTLISDLARFGVTGLSEVFRHFSESHFQVPTLLWSLADDLPPRPPR